MTPAAAGKACLSVSHRLCQTQAPFAKTKQISTRAGPGEPPRSPGPRKPPGSGERKAGWRGRATNSLSAALRARDGGRGGTGRSEGRLPSPTSRPLERKGPGGRGRGVGERGGCGAGARAQQRRSRGLVGAVPASLGQRKARGRGEPEAPGRRRAPFGFYSKGAAGEGQGRKRKAGCVRLSPQLQLFWVAPDATVHSAFQRAPAQPPPPRARAAPEAPAEARGRAHSPSP